MYKWSSALEMKKLVYVFFSSLKYLTTKEFRKSQELRNSVCLFLFFFPAESAKIKKNQDKNCSTENIGYNFR